MKKELSSPPPKPVKWIVQIRNLPAQVVGPCRTAFAAVQLTRNAEGLIPAFSQVVYIQHLEN